MAKSVNKEKTANRNALRAQYGFHKNYTKTAFGIHLLTLEHLRQANPGTTPVNLLKNLNAYKAKITAAEQALIQKKSEKLTEEYDATNKAASLKAIEDKAWDALKV